MLDKKKLVQRIGNSIATKKNSNNDFYLPVNVDNLSKSKTIDTTYGSKRRGKRFFKILETPKPEYYPISNVARTNVPDDNLSWYIKWKNQRPERTSKLVFRSKNDFEYDLLAL